jgi:hypothetical protein
MKLQYTQRWLQFLFLGSMQFFSSVNAYCSKQSDFVSEFDDEIETYYTCYFQKEGKCSSNHALANETDQCYEQINFIEYEPWESGLDAGLHTLPGSSHTMSCPTKPSGAQLYRTQGRLVHKYRYGIEYTPEEWRTIMLHMRSILPMTACSYRKILSLLQERPFKSKKRPANLKKTTSIDETIDSTTLFENELGNEELPAITITSSSTTESLLIFPAENFIEEAKLKPIAELLKEEEQLIASNELGELEDYLFLEDILDPIDVGEVDFTVDTLINGQSLTPKFNHVFTGFMSLFYGSPSTSFFGDLDGNNSFFYSVSPCFLASYGDSLLMATRLICFNSGQKTNFNIPYSYISYFYNDYITFQFGRFIIPLGVYFNYYVGWITKFPQPPLGRTFSFIVPPNDAGVEVKGAIPLCLLSKSFGSESTFTYDFWLGNGPSEVSPFTGSTSRTPSGTIFVDGPNVPNNNNSLTWGGRLAFLPNDSQIYGISYMKGRWSSNSTTFGKLGAALGRKLNYEAAALDWNINFNQYVTFRGEYIWTQYENSLKDFPLVTQSSYWALLAFDMAAVEYFFPKLHRCYPCFWNSLEFCLRSDALYNDPSGLTFWTGANRKGKAYKRRRFSLGLNYYFTQSFCIRTEYDINYGEEAINPQRAFVTDNYTKKTGFASNVFTLRIVYGW